MISGQDPQKFSLVRIQIAEIHKYLRKTFGQGNGSSVAGNNERHKNPEPVFISLVKILRYSERKTVSKKYLLFNPCVCGKCQLCIRNDNN